MSYKIIQNIDIGQFGTVFKIDKKEGYRGIKLNKITSQNNIATFSFNNNALRFIRLGVDYRNKPLKYLFKGSYNKFKPFYLLNQIFIPAIYKYETIQECQVEINNIITQSILNASIDVNKKISLYYNDNSTYNLIKESIIGTPKIPNLSTSIDGIETPLLYFKREFRNETDDCDCLNTDTNFQCFCKKTIELNCYVSEGQTITNTNFSVVSGTSIMEINTENTTLIFMNLDKSRLKDVIDDTVKNIYLQNDDELLVITENDDTITQSMIKIKNITSDSLMVTIKEYYLCGNCMMCNCCNQYNPDKGVYSIHYTIDEQTPNENNETVSVLTDLDIYLKDCESSILNGNIVFSNTNFNIGVDSIGTIEYIIDKKTIRTCCCDHKIPIYGESTCMYDNECLNYTSTVDNNLIQDYVITGWKIKINNIELTNNLTTLTTDYNPFKYKITILNSDSEITSEETLKSNGKITFTIPPNSTSNFPNINIENWKTSDVLFDQLFFNTFINDGIFMTTIEHGDYKFSTKINPIEFTSNLKSDLKFDFKNLSFRVENHGHFERYYASIIPQIFNYSSDIVPSAIKNEQLNLIVCKNGQEKITLSNVDYLKYMNAYLNVDKFYSLFGQLQESAWVKFGIVCNYINPDLLGYPFDNPSNIEWYNMNNKTNRIYNIIGNTFTQELYLYDDFVLNQNIYSKNKIVCQRKADYLNPVQFSNNASNYTNVVNDYVDIYRLKNKLLNNENKEFKLYKNGKKILTDTFILQIQPSLNYDNNIYLFQISFTDKIDYIINTHLDSLEIQKHNIKYVMTNKTDLKYDLEFKNLIYMYDETSDNKSIWLYLDSQYHYPFLCGTKAYLEVEYIPKHEY